MLLDFIVCEALDISDKIATEGISLENSLDLIKTRATIQSIIYFLPNDEGLIDQSKKLSVTQQKMTKAFITNEVKVINKVLLTEKTFQKIAGELDYLKKRLYDKYNTKWCKCLNQNILDKQEVLNHLTRALRGHQEEKNLTLKIAYNLLTQAEKGKLAQHRDWYSRWFSFFFNTPTKTILGLQRTRKLIYDPEENRKALS